jgi:hypothetical protein
MSSMQIVPRGRLSNIPCSGNFRHGLPDHLKLYYFAGAENQVKNS